MFKPGEIAKVRKSGQIVTIEAADVLKSGHSWLIATTGGVFNEGDLSPAHPSVLATASGRDLAAEAWRANIEEHTKTRTNLYDGRFFDVREKIEKVLKTTTFDFNGHWKNGAFIRGFNPLERLFLGPDALSKMDAEDLLRAVDSGKPLDRWIPVNVYLSTNGLRTCSCCGAEDFETETNGLVLRITGEPCRFPKGLPPTEWELNVPSGKLVVANDLRAVFPLPEDEDFNINTTRGCSLTALAYAGNGLSHAFVGNSCPGVYACKDGSFKIANGPSEEKWNGKEYVKIKPAPVFDGKKLAGICTDLWWYSICDYDEFKRRLKHFKAKAKDFNVNIVDVKPGVYRFSHDEDARRHDGPEECVYTRFQWVRESDPVKDFLAQYENVEVNAHAYVHAQVKRWPTLYGKKVDHGAWQHVADQAFCTGGSGVEWHEKGFPLAKADPSIPDVEPPHFRVQHHWYPFSKPYGGLFKPALLSPSFAKLAFRVLESVISFGTDVRDDNHGRQVQDVRSRMLLAVTRYRELAAKYPDQADPEYVAWLGQEGRAEAWVENFPLGPEFTQKHEDYVKSQRWVPEDAYAVAFDARKLKDGHFAWHPKKGGCWANKKDAQRYAILQHEPNGQSGKMDCFWTCHATNSSVPLYVVARVVKVGDVSHMGETLVELAFDYGTPWMLDTTKRKAVAELKEKAAIKVLTKEEYEKLLPKAAKFFTDAEAKIKG
jgi:hypothetical protein